MYRVKNPTITLICCLCGNYWTNILLSSFWTLTCLLHCSNILCSLVPFSFSSFPLVSIFLSPLQVFSSDEWEISSFSADIQKYLEAKTHPCDGWRQPQSVSVCEFVILTLSRHWADTEPLTVTPPLPPLHLLSSGPGRRGQRSLLKSRPFPWECGALRRVQWWVQPLTCPTGGWGGWRNVGINGAAWSKEEVKTGANSPVCHLFVQLTLASSPSEEKISRLSAFLPLLLLLLVEYAFLSIFIFIHKTVLFRSNRLDYWNPFLARLTKIRYSVPNYSDLCWPGSEVKTRYTCCKVFTLSFCSDFKSILLAVQTLLVSHM